MQAILYEYEIDCEIIILCSRANNDFMIISLDFVKLPDAIILTEGNNDVDQSHEIEELNKEISLMRVNILNEDISEKQITKPKRTTKPKKTVKKVVEK